VQAAIAQARAKGKSKSKGKIRVLPKGSASAPAPAPKSPQSYVWDSVRTAGTAFAHQNIRAAAAKAADRAKARAKARGKAKAALVSLGSLGCVFLDSSSGVGLIIIMNFLFLCSLIIMNLLLL